MRLAAVLWVSCCVAAGAVVSLSADNDVIDCAHRSLAQVVKNAAANETIRFTGVCAGPIEIRRNGITLKGVGMAAVDGGGSSDGVTVAGASRVMLNRFEVRNAQNGIVAAEGASVQLTDLNVHDNAGFGISVQTGSSAGLTGVTANHNGIHGLDLETGSAALVTGALTASLNRVFGINVNGSSITFSHATVAAAGNALGIQIATGANAFLNDAATAIDVSNNLSTGLTVVSGAHLVSFGGTISASGNPVNGVSINSKGGLDLDAGSTLNTFNNGDGVVLQESSVMTVFNTPQFSGAAGFSSINSHDNTGNGVRVLSGSTLTLVNQARIVGTANGRTGIAADNGAGVTLLNSTFTGNTSKDIQLTFGTRADFQTLVFGTYTCDATVLVRGTSGIVCPH